MIGRPSGMGAAPLGPQGAVGDGGGVGGVGGGGGVGDGGDVVGAPCQMSVGFFTLRPCGAPAVAGCGRCGRPVCGAHRVAAAVPLCIECAARERENAFDADDLLDTADDLAFYSFRQGFYTHMYGSSHDGPGFFDDVADRQALSFGNQQAQQDWSGDAGSVGPRDPGDPNGPSDSTDSTDASDLAALGAADLDDPNDPDDPNDSGDPDDLDGMDDAEQPDLLDS